LGKRKLLFITNSNRCLPQENINSILMIKTRRTFSRSSPKTLIVLRNLGAFSLALHVSLRNLYNSQQTISLITRELSSLSFHPVIMIVTRLRRTSMITSLTLKITTRLTHKKMSFIIILCRGPCGLSCNGRQLSGR